MRGEAFVEHREVGRDEIASGQIVPKQFGEEELRLGLRRLGEQVVEVIIAVEVRIGRGGEHLAQVEPVIEERVDELARLRMGEQALGLCAQHVGFVQLATRGDGSQFVIRSRVPQEVRETRGERIIVEAAGLFLEANELRRAEYAGVTGEQRIGEVVSLFQRVANYGQKSLQVRFVRW